MTYKQSLRLKINFHENSIIFDGEMKDSLARKYQNTGNFTCIPDEPIDVAQIFFSWGIRNPFMTDRVSI